MIVSDSDSSALTNVPENTIINSKLVLQLGIWNIQTMGSPENLANG